MKKLLIGIVAVALLGLLVVPAMAYLDQETVDVEINVLSYGAIEFSATPTLAFDVEGPYEPGVPYGASIEFSVKCNCGTNLSVNVPAGQTSEATAAPGTGFYPHATCGSHRIGFGVALTNLTTGEYDPWNKLLAGWAKVSFGASQVGETFPNARITVNSYMDSARDGDVLAPPGLYGQTLTLTLNVQ